MICGSLNGREPSGPIQGYIYLYASKAINLFCVLFHYSLYRNIDLPRVLDGCETWSFTLGEERRLRVSEKRVLRKIFGPKSDEETG
jgi:hypothetical protein